MSPDIDLGLDQPSGWARTKAGVGLGLFYPSSEESDQTTLPCPALTGRPASSSAVADSDPETSPRPATLVSVSKSTLISVSSTTRESVFSVWTFTSSWADRATESQGGRGPLPELDSATESSPIRLLLGSSRGLTVSSCDRVQDNAVRRWPGAFGLLDHQPTNRVGYLRVLHV